MIQVQPEQKISKTSFHQINGAWLFMPIIPGMLEAEVGNRGLRSGEGKNSRTLQKNK